MLETLRLVREQEPEHPGALNPRVDRDLETIVLKCLEKHPLRRYHSALALAEDLERWLDHLPILARPATPLHRAVKWVRRRPAAAALVLAASVAVLATAAAIRGYSSAAEFRGAFTTEREKHQRAQQALIERRSRELPRPDPFHRRPAGKHRSHPRRPQSNRRPARRLPTPPARLGVGLPEKAAQRRHPHDPGPFGLRLRHRFSARCPGGSLRVGASPRIRSGIPAAARSIRRIHGPDGTSYGAAIDRNRNTTRHRRVGRSGQGLEHRPGAARITRFGPTKAGRPTSHSVPTAAASPPREKTARCGSGDLASNPHPGAPGPVPSRVHRRRMRRDLRRRLECRRQTASPPPARTVPCRIWDLSQTCARQTLDPSRT